MNLEQFNLYPTNVRFGKVDFFNGEDFKQIQDMVENRIRFKETLNNIHGLPAYSDPGLFEVDSHPILRLKDLFEKTALEMHEEVYPHMKDKFKILDTTCKGVIQNQMTFDSPRCNVPWSYTGIFIIATPAGLSHPEGSITFLDPRPYSAEIDLNSMASMQGMLVIFPSWQRYYFNPIKNPSGFIISLTMNTMIMHDISYKENVKFVGKTSNNSDVNIVEIQNGDEGEVDIGRF